MERTSGQTRDQWPQWAALVLDELREHGSIRGAAGKAGIRRQTIHELAQRSPEFREAIEQAKSASLGNHEVVYTTRSRDGWVETTVEYEGGVEVRRTEKHKYSPEASRRVLEALGDSRWRRHKEASAGVHIQNLNIAQQQMLSSPETMEAAARLAALLAAPQSPQDALEAPLGQILEAEPAGPQEGD